MKPGGPLDHKSIAPIVADLFLGGIGAVKAPAPRADAAPASRPDAVKESG
jgi:hypothetical protein